MFHIETIWLDFKRKSHIWQRSYIMVICKLNKANLTGDLIAATGLVILLKFDSNRRLFSARMAFAVIGWPRKTIGHLFYAMSSFVHYFKAISELHQPRLWFITGGYLVKHWFIPADARARGQSNDLNREILASNLFIFNCHKEVINAPPVPSISRCIHIVYRHKNVWEYQWSNFIYNCMSTFWLVAAAPNHIRRDWCGGLQYTLLHSHRLLVVGW